MYTVKAAGGNNDKNNFRSKMKRGKNHFQDKWLKEIDPNGDLYNSYMSKDSEYSVKCNWCKVILSFHNCGLAALKRHALSKSHTIVSIHRSKRNDDVVQVKSSETLERENETEEIVDDPLPNTDTNNSENPSSLDANVAPPKSSTSQSNDKTIKRFFSTVEKTKSVEVVTESNNNNSTNGNNFMSLSDKTSRAEILLILQSVYKNTSLQSLESLQSLLKVAFPDSQIAGKVSLSDRKASYCITDGIGPYLLDEAIKDIKEADVYVMGCDTATTKHLGLRKGLDIQIRYYSVKYQKVVDTYLCSVSLGHETSEKMVEVCVTMLKEKGLDLSKLFVVSRDNPNVMKSFGKKFDETLKEYGNPCLIESPCCLHPTHTAFKKGIGKIGMNVDLFLVNVHGWFKLSTARREDMIEIRKGLEEINEEEFFLRHVSSRWLTMLNVVQRILNHWQSLCEYFAVFVANSKDPSHVQARETDRYKKIINILKPTESHNSYTRLQFVVYLCNKTQIFLKNFQSEKPMAHRLFTDSIMLVSSLMSSVIKPEYIPKNCSGREFLKFDFEKEGVLLPDRKCDFGPVVKDSISKCSEDDRKLLRKSFREATVTMIKYLISHLPLDNNLLKELSQTNPVMMESNQFAAAMLKVAKITKRFSESELQNLDNQLKFVTLSRSLPKYDEKIDTYDQFWLKKVIQKARLLHGDEFYELTKLVKIISVYPNSQAFVERGFNDTKRIADTRQSCSEQLMASSKVIMDVVRKAGAPENIRISPELIIKHRSAAQNYKMRLIRENMEKEKAAAELRLFNETQEKKRKYDAEHESWESKVAKIKSDIEVLKDTLDKQNETQMKALSNAAKYESKAKKDSAIKLAQTAAESVLQLRTELDLKQSSLAKLMSKKPKCL